VGRARNSTALLILLLTFRNFLRHDSEMKTLFLLVLFTSVQVSAATYICDLKNSHSDFVVIEVTKDKTESIVMHKVDSAAGTHIKALLFQRDPAVRDGQVVDTCKADDQNMYLPYSKSYSISSLCASKSSGQPISVSAEFSENTGGVVQVRSLSGYYSVKFNYCSTLPL
jgi:hypothetical protein